MSKRGLKRKYSGDTEISDRYVEKGRRGYSCTLCSKAERKEMWFNKPSRLRTHLESQIHRERADYEDLRALDIAEPFDSGLLHETSGSATTSVEWRAEFPRARSTASTGSASMLELEDMSNIQSTPPSPRLPTTNPIILEYNFFNDGVYEDLMDEHRFPANAFGFNQDAKGSAEGQESSRRATAASTSKNNGEADSMWGLFGDKQHFLTHSMFNTAHVRFSRAQQEIVLDWAREMGLIGVPTLNSLDACEARIQEVFGEGSHDTGHIYYVNRIDKMIQQDLSNPLVRNKLEFYPHDDDGVSSEFWHGEKLSKGENLFQLTPMATLDKTVYFVDEICELSDGNLFIPDMFLRKKGDLWARGRRLVSCGAGTNEYILDPELSKQPLRTFRQNCIGLQKSGREVLVVADGGKSYSLEPNTLRKRTNGRPVYSVPFVIFVDDVSGNISKQWNKHWCCYISNASLPREEINKRYNVRFMCTTQHASPMEMLDGIQKEFTESFEQMILAWDVQEQCEVFLRPYILVIVGDNPMQAQECSSTGLKSGKFCRTCDIGGTNEFKVSDEGFSQIFQTGNIRSASKTIAHIEDQFKIAFTATSVEKLTSAQRQTGVKDSIAQPLLDQIIKRRQALQQHGLAMPKISEKLRSEFDARGAILKMNPLLSMPGLNVHIDTPTETLHTILLGAVKYIWGQTVHNLDKSKAFDAFAARLRGAEVRGLQTGPVSSYIISNRGSLNGKHFKILGQIAIFGLHGLISQELFNCWYSLGRLMVLVWYSEIKEINAYTAELQALIDDFLHAVAKCSPRLLADRAKGHLLVHMPLFVRRFGPLVGPNTERYESFNGTFRQCSILSNGHAPSRDIARTFARFDRMKHIVAGGYYFDPQVKKYVQGGAGVLEMSKYSRFIARLFALNSNKLKQHEPGHATVPRKSKPVSWANTKSRSIKRPTYIRSTSQFSTAETCIATNGDTLAPGSVVSYTTI